MWVGQHSKIFAILLLECGPSWDFLRRAHLLEEDFLVLVLICYFEIYDISDPSFLLLCFHKASCLAQLLRRVQLSNRSKQHRTFFQTFDYCRLFNPKITTHCIASRQAMSRNGVRYNNNMLMLGCSDINHFITISRCWLHQYIRFNVTSGNEIQEEYKHICVLWNNYSISWYHCRKLINRNGIFPFWFVFKSVRSSIHSLVTFKGMRSLPVTLIVFLIFAMSVFILFTIISTSCSLFLVSCSATSQVGSCMSGKKT